MSVPSCLTLQGAPFTNEGDDLLIDDRAQECLRRRQGRVERRPPRPDLELKVLSDIWGFRCGEQRRNSYATGDCLDDGGGQFNIVIAAIPSSGGDGRSSAASQVV